MIEEGLQYQNIICFSDEVFFMVIKLNSRSHVDKVEIAC